MGQVANAKEAVEVDVSGSVDVGEDVNRAGLVESVGALQYMALALSARLVPLLT